LDIEMAISMAPGLSQVVVYVGSNDVSIFSRMASDNTSKQLSCSWGWSDNESSLDPIFKEFAAQGQTVFVATGDDGSATPANTVWPADDPYVIAVGGTDLTTNGAGGPWASETGWNGSAGGPSKNGIPIPGYQQLAGVINASNDGSTTLRNIPDVAAEANTNQYSCYDGACSGGNGGTSYAAPQWAGFTAMVNQQAVANGRATVGFLNPAIYRFGLSPIYDSDFHDIVSGSNGKYSAVAGYDLVTGWGSFDGPNLIDWLTGSQ
jgi:subtilase family serine protease